MSERIATPGSDEAKRHKCSCGVALNHHGKGAYHDQAGRLVFIPDRGCPLHGEGSAWSTGDAT